MKTLHPIQKKLLDLLIKNDAQPLTVREMQEELELSSTSGVAHHLQQLEKKGYVKRNPFNPQDFQILNGPQKQVVLLNLYGFAHCGPNGSLLDGAVEDRIAISSKLLNFPAEEGFLIRAKGDSMLPKISDGDLVIGKRAQVAHSGSLVVCINNGEAMIKKFHLESAAPDFAFTANDFLDYDPRLAKRRAGRTAARGSGGLGADGLGAAALGGGRLGGDKKQKIILTSLNPAFPPFLAAPDFRIEGEVRGVIAHLR